MHFNRSYLHATRGLKLWTTLVDFRFNHGSREKKQQEIGQRFRVLRLALLDKWWNDENDEMLPCGWNILPWQLNFWEEIKKKGVWQISVSYQWLKVSTAAIKLWWNRWAAMASTVIGKCLSEVKIRSFHGAKYCLSSLLLFVFLILLF